MANKGIKLLSFALAILLLCVSCTKSSSNRIIGTWLCIEDRYTDGSPCNELLGVTWSFNENMVHWSGEGWAASVNEYTLTDNRFLSIHFHNMGDYSFMFEITELSKRKMVVKWGDELATFKKQ